MADFVGLLTKERISRVVDVRALPLSRRRGFSKTPLSTALAAAGIEYVHLREAGNPYRDRKADIQNCLRMYRGHLEQSPEVVEHVESALQGRRAALLCVEADSQCCHRSIIVDQLRARSPGRSVKNL